MILYLRQLCVSFQTKHDSLPVGNCRTTITTTTTTTTTTTNYYY